MAGSPRKAARPKRTGLKHRHATALEAWQASSKQTWLAEETYLRRSSRLAEVTVSVLSSTLGVSKSYAADIREGGRRPHPRHWATLARLVGVCSRRTEVSREDRKPARPYPSD